MREWWRPAVVRCRLAVPARLLAVCLLTSFLLSACGRAEAGSEAAEAVFRVEVRQCSVVDLQVATAVAVTPDLAATVAHSLDRVEGLVLIDAGGRAAEAEIIYIDQPRDVALLRLVDGGGLPLELADPEPAGDVSIVTSVDDAAPETKDAAILDLVTATLDGEGRRAAIKLRADVEPGDSGAPVVDQQGRMVGMVFATARNDEVGWAVAVSEIRSAVDEVNADRPEALPPAC